MSAHVLPVFCCSTNPRPCRLASVHNHVGFSGSKKESVGADMSDCLAWSSSGIHLVLRRGRSGASSPEMAAVLATSWLTRPKKERISVRLVGVGKFAIASVIDWSTW